MNSRGGSGGGRAASSLGSSGPEAVLGQDRLPLVGAQEGEERLGDLAVAVPLDRRVRPAPPGLSIRSVAGRDDVGDRLRPSSCAEEQLVLVGDDRVAGPALEGRHALPARGVHVHDVAPGPSPAGRGRPSGRASALDSRARQPRAVDGVDVPAGPAGGLRVGVEDADAGPGQVGPVADPLRVARRGRRSTTRLRVTIPLVGPVVPVLARPAPP